jgi:hypothetical protein
VALLHRREHRGHLGARARKRIRAAGGVVAARSRGGLATGF